MVRAGGPLTVIIKSCVIVKGEHIAVGALHDIDIAHKTFSQS